MNLGKLYHPETKTYHKIWIFILSKKMLGNVTFLKIEMLKRFKGAFYYNWCPEYTSVDIKRPLKIRCAEIWSNTILKLQLNTHPNIYKGKTISKLIEAI